MRYQALQAERREALQTGQGGVSWFFFFAVQISMLLLLLDAQRAAYGSMPLLIHAGSKSDPDCTCGRCPSCFAGHESDYSR